MLTHTVKKLWLRGGFPASYLAESSDISWDWRKNYVKTFRDSGLLHFFLRTKKYSDLLHHPKLGASWEGFALEEIIRANHADPEECFFWNVHNQYELDLMLFKDNKRLGFEFKFSDAPRFSPSLVSIRDNLKLDRLFIIYPGKKNYPLEKRIEVIGLEDYLDSLG